MSNEWSQADDFQLHLHTLVEDMEDVFDFNSLVFFAAHILAGQKAGLNNIPKGDEKLLTAFIGYCKGVDALFKEKLGEDYLQQYIDQLPDDDD